MHLLSPEITNLIFKLASAGLFTTAIIWICKIIITYIQRNKDKRIQMKKSANGEIDVTFTGYSMLEVKEITKGNSLKKIIIQPGKKHFGLQNRRDRNNSR